MQKRPAIFRTRFAEEITAEMVFSRDKKGRVIILASGAPSLPYKKRLLQFLSDHGYIVIFPRYRGTWESTGEFLKRSPHEDILDIVDELLRKKKILNLEEGKMYPIKVHEVILIGVSFGGPAVLLASVHPLVKKVIAFAPVIDWRRSGPDEPFEVFKKYTREAFGGAYRATEKNWVKLRQGNFYSPLAAEKKLPAEKFLLFHAKDDRVVPFVITQEFAKRTGARFMGKETGGHLSSRILTYKRNWKIIQSFLNA